MYTLRFDENELQRLVPRMGMCGVINGNGESWYILRDRQGVEKLRERIKNHARGKTRFRPTCEETRYI